VGKFINTFIVGNIQVPTMTTRKNAAIQIRKMRKVRSRVTTSKSTAVAALKAAGIFGSDGRISDRYPALKSAVRNNKSGS